MNQLRYDEYKNRHTIAKRLTPAEIEECLEEYFQLGMPVEVVLEKLSGIRLETECLLDTLRELP